MIELQLDKVQGKSQITSKLLNYFWAGFIIYTISFSFGTTSAVNQALIELFQVIGIAIFMPAALILIKFRLENSYLKIIYTLYCCWLLVVVMRGISFEYIAVKKTLFDPNNSIFLYFVPYIILLPSHLSYFNKIFRSIIILTVTYFILNILFFKEIIQAKGGDETSRDIIDYFAKTLAIPSGLLLLTYIYHSKQVVFLALASVLLTLLLAAVCGRRGLMFMSSVILLFSYILYCYKNRGKIINVVLSIVAVLILILYTSSLFFDKDVKMFEYTKGRLDEDSRSVVELFFYDDMNEQDWLIGRGMNGLVAAPLSAFMENVEGIPGYREGIETDYLKIILKGGIISLGLLLSISLPAIFLGLFYSNNILCKASALWILVWMLSLYPTNVTNFTMNYILVWICINICYSRYMRRLEETSIKIFFQDKLLINKYK